MSIADFAGLHDVHHVISFVFQAEQLVLAAYVALLIGCLMRDHLGNRRKALSQLPDGSTVLLIRVLKAFLSFQKQVGVLTSLVHDPIAELIHEMEDLPISPPSLPFEDVPPSLETLAEPSPPPPKPLITRKKNEKKRSADDEAGTTPVARSPPTAVPRQQKITRYTKTTAPAELPSPPPQAPAASQRSKQKSEPFRPPPTPSPPPKPPITRKKKQAVPDSPPAASPVPSPAKSTSSTSSRATKTALNTTPQSTSPFTPSAPVLRRSERNSPINPPKRSTPSPAKDDGRDLPRKKQQIDGGRTGGTEINKGGSNTSSNVGTANGGSRGVVKKQSSPPSTKSSSRPPVVGNKRKMHLRPPFGQSVFDFID